MTAEELRLKWEEAKANLRPDDANRVGVDLIVSFIEEVSEKHTTQSTEPPAEQPGSTVVSTVDTTIVGPETTI